MIKIKSDKIIVGDTLFDGTMYVLNGKIVEISKEDKPCEKSYDYTGKYVSAGFIDIHTHGAGGFAFMNSSIEDVIAGCDYHLAHGTTSIVPTISAGSFETMKQAVINIHKAKGKTKGHILGAHLEGPYLSAKQCGAQCPIFITPPIQEDYESLIEEYGESICRWTYAPENDENGDFSEASHRDCDGDTGILNILKAYHDCGVKGYIRPDHGRHLWGEKAGTVRPGYGLYDRALGIMYMLGVWDMLDRLEEWK